VPDWLPLDRVQLCSRSQTAVRGIAQLTPEDPPDDRPSTSTPASEGNGTNSSGVGDADPAFWSVVEGLEQVGWEYLKQFYLDSCQAHILCC
jgi:hypothetical protein